VGEGAKPKAARQKRARGNDDDDDDDAAAEGPRFMARALQCRDCGAQFMFGVAEQRRPHAGGFPPVRTRCDGCKAYKKNRFAAKVGVREPTRNEQPSLKGKGTGGGRGRGRGRMG
jgi:hypothetical protein